MQTLFLGIWHREKKKKGEGQGKDFVFDFAMRHSNWNVSRLGREGKPEGRGWDPSKKGSDR